MKQIHLFAAFFVTALLGNTGIADDKLPPLKIEGMKPSYSLNEPIAIMVVNSTSGGVAYGVGVIGQTANGQWQEFLTNIEDHKYGRKTLALRDLSGNKSEILKWNPKDVDEIYPVKKGIYRFYIAFTAGANDRKRFLSETAKNIGSEFGKHNQQLIFSDPFELK